ncbi:MAG: GNAT family N-acetyltransferase, partial [Bacteroidia bacterium]|nr:GNAT family N-acetyltransferase [Bacteroidia bacterium]
MTGKYTHAVIDPVDNAIIMAELSAEGRFIRKTNKGNNEIYILNARNSPHTMREIGRLRELTFRAAGGGTGEEVDIDEYDTGVVHYEQLIVYSPEDKQIVGGYRFIDCFKAIDTLNNKVNLSTASYFHFSDKF